MQAFLGFDHVQVCCPPGGEAAVRAFYGDLLGLPQVSQPEHLLERGGCWFRVGGQGLHVGVADPHAPATTAHPALRVRDRATLDAIASRLQAAGLEVAWAAVPVAEARCKVHDPFGNLVELLVGTTG